LMDVFEAIKGRRSIRRFTPEDVDDETLLKVLDAARWAPSAGNLQPWNFIVVRSPERKRRLAEAALGQQFIAEAPVDIVVCADTRVSSWGYGSRGEKLYCIQDTAAAVQNMLLAAYALGLGTCWVGAFDERRVAEVVGLPDGVRPVAIIALGHPAERPAPRPRRGLEEVVHVEVYGRRLLPKRS